jgi:DNA-binding NarL/FixJ family response regulator
MDRKQLLLVTQNADLINCLEKQAITSYNLTTVKNVHAAYPIAVNQLPDIILMDYSSFGLESLKNIDKFKSTHFLNRCFLFLYGDQENKKVLDKNFKDLVDGIIYDKTSFDSILDKIEETINLKKCLTNYWKDSFMGLFNLLEHPVILLQEDKIIAMNDAFKRDFFITKNEQITLSDLVIEEKRPKVKETIRKFVRGKHMKATTVTSLIMNDKLREARVTFSKLDKAVTGQMIMMINLTGKDNPLKEEIGTCSKETEKYFACNDEDSKEKTFTKREKEIIGLLCKGYKTREISEALCISAKTIEKHRTNITRRTHSGTILESIVYALNHKMIDI